MTITQTDDTPPFFFVSDNYTVGQVRNALDENCFGLTISDPIQFNSTGNIQYGSVVQYYRGDSAAILLRGYEDAMESPNNSPFQLTINVTTWACLNGTIGASIPLMNRSSGHRFPLWGVFLITLGLVALFGYYGYLAYTRGYFNRFKRDDPFTRLPEQRSFLKGRHRRRRGPQLVV
jgi:hypothetical protein